MLVRTVYLACQLIKPEHFQPELLDHWTLSANRVILQVDAIDDGMKWVLPIVLRRFSNITLQYFTMDVQIPGTTRKFLLSLEDMGVQVEIHPEPLVGMSLYAVIRRYKYRAARADHVLIIYDHMNRAVQSAIKSAKKNDCDAYVICCEKTSD